MKQHQHYLYVIFASIMSVCLLFEACAPNEPQPSIIFTSCKKIYYDVQSEDSLSIAILVTSTGNPQVAWFKAQSPTYTFYSSPIYVNAGCNETLQYRLRWKPNQDSCPPITYYKTTAHMAYDYYNDFTPWVTPKELYIQLQRTDIVHYLSIYSGDSQKVSINENLDDTSAFMIRVQLRDADNIGVNDRNVQFSTSHGYFLGSSQPHIVQTTTNRYNVDGIAEAILYCNVFSQPSDSFDYCITVSSDSASLISIYERCSGDEDDSHLPFPYTHKKRYYPNGDEIAGDLYAEYEDPDPTNKDIKVEIDYDPAYITLPDVGDIAANAWNILETGRISPDSASTTSGFWVIFENISDEDTVIAPYEASEEQVRDALERSGDFNDHIHCLVLSKYGNCLGFNFVDTLYEQSTFTDYTERVFRYGHTSSGPNAHQNLSRSGIGIFVTHIKTIAQNANPPINWKLLASWVLAHEIGHSLQMGHTHPDSFQTNFMHHPTSFSDWDYDDYSFFNIRSLKDSFMPLYPDHIWALITREKFGINTVGINFYDRPSKNVFGGMPNRSKVLVNPDNQPIIEQMEKILQKDEIVNMNLNYRGHSEPFIMRTEKDGTLCLLYATTENTKIAYNFIQCDSIGNIIKDLRKFTIIDPIIANNIETVELTVPCADYFFDETGQLWLFYTCGPSTTEKYINWIKVNKDGVISKKQSTDFKAYKSIRSIPNGDLQFHLYLQPYAWIYPYYQYYNPSLEHPMPTSTESEPNRVIEPFDAYEVIPISRSRLLIVSCDIYKPFLFKYIIINKNGKVEKAMKPIPIDDCAYAKINNHGMIFNVDGRVIQDTVLIGVSVWTPWLKNKVNAFYTVKFDIDGNLILPEDGINEGELYDFKGKPDDVIQTYLFTWHSGIENLWRYGFDKKGNLYVRKWARQKD
jgi:hypothetical protein